MVCYTNNNNNNTNNNIVITWIVLTINRCDNYFDESKINILTIGVLLLVELHARRVG